MPRPQTGDDGWKTPESAERARSRQLAECPGGGAAQETECWQRGPELRGGERKNPALRKNLASQGSGRGINPVPPRGAAAPVRGAKKVLLEMC